jgi:glycogen(starch) synthase
MNPEADYVFEASWEVCNKVGGIYTVIKSKASRMMDLYKNYILIGPYFEHNARVDFVKVEPPPEFSKVFDNLKNEGIICHFGKWIEVKDKPFTILIDFNGIIHKKDTLKAQYWEDYGIDSLRGYWDFEEPSIWSYAIGRMLEQLKYELPNKKIVVQFHEWLSAFALLYLKKNCKDIATVFTTHATILGRTLASNGIDLYTVINTIDPIREAYNHNIEAKFLTEKAAALNADVFTTVSEITGIEAEKFFGRKPEVLVLNGLDIDKFPNFEDISIKHISSRDKIREFLTYYFFPYYIFDVTNNLIFYTSGRFEYRNKGYDIFIKALGRLNEYLKNECRGKNIEEIKHISVFFWIPMAHHGIRLDVFENKSLYMHIKGYVNSHTTEILSKIVYDFISKKQNISESLLLEHFFKDIKKDLESFTRKGNPPLSTHNVEEQNNPLMNDLRSNGLLNRKEDVVKIIIEPIYLDSADGFINLNYYDSMIGCNLGLFPSYYEPWGYTPLESAALGVPSLTTDLSGFGMYIKEKNLNKKGIFVLERFNKNEEEVLKNFVDIMLKFYHMEHSERVSCKLDAKSLATYADWKVLIENYLRSHNLALSNNADKRNNPLLKAK